MLQNIFAEIEQELGRVPSLFRAYARHPELLKLNWEKFRLLMLQGYLPRQLKEAIALAVSEDNHCDYGIHYHSAALESLGLDPHEVLLIRTDPNHAHQIPKDHALLALARQDNLAPYDHGETLIDNARTQGASDREIVEALGVVEMVAGFNHFADMLALPLE
jgi:uncharacterized peroxidase-related enzyme